MGVNVKEAIKQTSAIPNKKLIIYASIASVVGLSLAYPMYHLAIALGAMGTDSGTEVAQSSALSFISLVFLYIFFMVLSSVVSMFFVIKQKMSSRSVNTVDYKVALMWSAIINSLFVLLPAIFVLFWFINYKLIF